MARTLDPEVDERLHAAAIALLACEGFAGVTVDAIAAHARVGKAAIYRRYRSKEDLIVGAVAAELPMGEPPAGLTGAAALAALGDRATCARSRRRRRLGRGAAHR